jgi:hypothetical protein
MRWYVHLMQDLAPRQDVGGSFRICSLIPFTFSFTAPSACCCLHPRGTCALFPPNFRVLFHHKQSRFPHSESLLAFCSLSLVEQNVDTLPVSLPHFHDACPHQHLRVPGLRPLRLCHRHTCSFFKHHRCDRDSYSRRRSSHRRGCHAHHRATTRPHPTQHGAHRLQYWPDIPAFCTPRYLRPSRPSYHVGQRVDPGQCVPPVHRERRHLCPRGRVHERGLHELQELRVLEVSLTRDARR